MTIPAHALRLAATACVLAIPATALARAIARRTGFVNKPNPIVPQHTAPVAYLGGVGLALGLVAAFPVAAWLGAGAAADAAGVPSRLFAYLIPGAVLLVMGVVDDRHALGPAVKFGLQAVIALGAVLGGVVTRFFGAPLLDGAISWLVLATCINAFNLLDVCDGLLAGTSAVAFVFLALLRPTEAPFAMAAAGACVGVLVFNRPPASIFLGDAGSQLLGFLAGAIALRGGPSDGTAVWPDGFAVALILGVPLFELAFLVVVRAGKGLPWWRGSPDHLALRLQAAGRSRLETDLIAWSGAVVLGLAGLTLRVTTPVGQALVVLASLGALASAWRLLLRWEVRR